MRALDHSGLTRKITWLVGNRQTSIDSNNESLSGHAQRSRAPYSDALGLILGGSRGFRDTVCGKISVVLCHAYLSQTVALILSHVEENRR